MKKSIILLTKTFPFTKGEEFLEEEIRILSEYFQRIFIVATAVPKGSFQQREVPSNITAFALHETEKRYLKYAKYTLKGMVHFFDKDTQDDFKGKASLGKLGVIYMAGRCNCLVKKILCIPEIAEQLRERDTILYSYWFADLPYILVRLKRIVGNRDLKIISRAHGYDLYDYRNASGHIPFRSIVLGEIDQVFPCSIDGQNYLRQRYPVYANKIEVAYLGTKDCGIGNTIRHHRFHIVTCSSIIPLKRLHLVAEALKVLEDNGFSCNWTCIGDGPLLEALKAYVKGNLTKCQVTFAGRLRHNKVLELLKKESFDLFVNVSETEGLPVSIMEAASFGIPILATDVGGTKEIVIPQETGVLIPKDITANDLAVKILSFQKASFNREQIRAFWEEHFNSSTNYHIFAEKLQKI